MTKLPMKKWWFPYWTVELTGGSSQRNRYYRIDSMDIQTLWIVGFCQQTDKFIASPANNTHTHYVLRRFPGTVGEPVHGFCPEKLRKKTIKPARSHTLDWLSCLDIGNLPREAQLQCPTSKVGYYKLSHVLHVHPFSTASFFGMSPTANMLYITWPYLLLEPPLECSGFVW